MRRVRVANLLGIILYNLGFKASFATQKIPNNRVRGLEGFKAILLTATLERVPSGVRFGLEVLEAIAIVVRQRESRD